MTETAPPEGLLLDIDGTVLDTGRPIEGAAEAIAKLRARGVPFLFATNISRDSRAGVAASLREAGLDVADDEVLSAGFAAAARLRAAGIVRVCALLPEAALADWQGFELVDRDAEAVVVGDMGSEFTFEVLNDAFRCLFEGARLVATHKNRYWKSGDGWTLDAGAFVAALEYAARTEAELVGKPSAGFFGTAAAILSSSPEKLAIVGDDLESDIAGGRAAGLTTILVRTGKFREDRLADTPPELAPHAVLDSIRDVPALVPDA